MSQPLSYIDNTINSPAFLLVGVGHGVCRELTFRKVTREMWTYSRRFGLVGDIFSACGVTAS